MKPDHITKLYDRLTNKERAALAFSYMADVNELELDRVASAVPVHTYRCTDFEYRDWLDGFNRMSLLWAVEHWQASTRRVAALGAAQIMLEKKAFDKADVMTDVHDRWESRLLALDGALLAVCGEHGLDPNAIRLLAGTQPFVPICDNRKPDAEYQAEMQANMNAVLEAGRH